MLSLSDLPILYRDQTEVLYWDDDITFSQSKMLGELLSLEKPVRDVAKGTLYLVPSSSPNQEIYEAFICLVDHFLAKNKGLDIKSHVYNETTGEVEQL